jgi:phospholipid/cholesterol/gamma-HCH transport system substrate-binding protein
METRAHYVAVGAFVLAIIVLSFAAIVSLGRVEFAQDLNRYYIFFKGSVTGLSKGSLVQYNGITVGRVVDVRVDPDDLEKIQVTVEIDSNLVKIKTDARAFVETTLLSGVATIQIRGGTREAADLNDLLNERNRKAISETLQNVQAITGAFVAPSKEVGELVDNANATLLKMTTMLGHIDESYASKGGLKDEASQTLSDFDRLARNLIDTNRQLQQVLQENRPGLREFTQATLAQVSNLATDAQRFIAGLTRFLSSVERDPARLLFGERREGYRPQ